MACQAQGDAALARIDPGPGGKENGRAPADVDQLGEFTPQPGRHRATIIEDCFHRIEVNHG